MANTNANASTSLPISSLKTESPTVASPSSPTDYSDTNSMAIAPYVPPTSLFQDFNLPFATGDSANGLWDFGSTDGGGIPFVSGAQLEGQQNLQTANVTGGQQVNGTMPIQEINNNNSAGPSSGGSQIPTHIAKNNPFLNKLRSMVDDPATNDLICWSKDGETFLVPNHVRFGDEVLPRFFKHNRFSSFVRQLNMYGFHKVPHLQQGALKSDLGQENELWEFKNDNFKRDRPELLLNMQRKKGVRNDDEGGKGKGKDLDQGEEGGTPLDDMSGALMRQRKDDSEGGALQLASVWSAIQSIQSAQQGINDNLRHLHNSNSELFREAAEQRTRSQKQEETINKMLRFLAGVFGAQDVGGLGSGEKRGGQGTSSSSGQGDGKRRRVVVRPSFSKNKSGRLMIGDSNMADGEQIEELEVPMDDDEVAANIEELSPFSRSNTNSPRGGTSPKHTLSPTDSPKLNKNQDLPSISSEVISTPGGGRRISQQAGAQILSALASGDGSAWLANLFGQQQQNDGQGLGQGVSPSKGGSDKAAATPGGNGFKLDAQTLATLQSVLGGMSNSEGMPGVNNSYFGGGNSADSRAGTPLNSNSAWSSAQQPSMSSSAQPWAPGANTSAQANSVGSNQRNQSVVTPIADNNQIARLTRNYQNLQGTGQDAAMVQNAFNALVDGLRMENGGKGNSNVNGNTSNGNVGVDGTSGASVPTPTPPQTMPQAMDESGNGSGSGSADVDMDLLLKEFLNSNASTSSNTALTPNAMENSFPNGMGGGMEGQTPEFAFTPNGNGVEPEDEAENGSQDRRSSSGTTLDNTSAASTPGRGSPIPSSNKKRKPSGFEGALGADIERANAKAVKNARRSSVKTATVE